MRCGLSEGGDGDALEDDDMMAGLLGVDDGRADHCLKGAVVLIEIWGISPQV
jgi:hypothetical protein